MKILSEFLGNLRDLSFSEIRGLLKAYGGKLIERQENYVIFETEHPMEIANRITFSRRLSRVVRIEDLDLTGRTFSIRERRGPGKDSMIDYFARRIGGRVDLERPDFRFYIYNFDEPIFTELIFERRMNLLLDSRYNSRPFNHPSSISPLLARAMINISSLKEGLSFVDPFVGTGTFLIEANRMGIRGIGIDRDKRMIEGCRKNIEHFGFHSELIHGDFSEIKNIRDFEAVVTDPPYGRGARIFSDSKLSLYDRFFSLLAEIKVPKVFAVPSGEIYDLSRQYMEPEIVGRVRMHSSLTRIIIRA